MVSSLCLSTLNETLWLGFFLQSGVNDTFSHHKRYSFTFRLPGIRRILHNASVKELGSDMGICMEAKGTVAFETGSEEMSSSTAEKEVMR